MPHQTATTTIAIVVAAVEVVEAAEIIKEVVLNLAEMTIIILQVVGEIMKVRRMIGATIRIIPMTVGVIMDKILEDKVILS